MSSPKEIFVRMDRCVGCHSCELACAVEHSAGKSLYTAIVGKPAPRKRLYVEAVGDRSVPLVCRHCEDAPCAGVCRTGSMTQDPLTRIVSHAPDKCIGCWMCAMACPYGMVGRMKEYRAAVKCDRCPDREQPACVSACLTRALVFTGEEEFSKMIRAKAAAQF